jgi:DNA-binding response OmpR family regulator
VIDSTAEPSLVVVADQLYAELQVVARRLRRLQTLLGGVVVLEEDAALWARAGEVCLQALRAVEVAVSAVPDVPVETDRGERRYLVVGELRLDTVARRAWFGSSELSLCRLELRLLEALASSPMQVWTKRQLLQDVWDYRSMPTTRTVDSHASRLRRKLIAAGAAEGQWIINVWSVGYALCRP